jgi:hypothetical protein
MSTGSAAERCDGSASGSNLSQVQTCSYSTSPHLVRFLRRRPMVIIPHNIVTFSPGLDSVSASKVVSVLHALAHDAENPTAVIATIHQPSSQIYRVFDRIVLLAGGRCLYEGSGGFAPAEYFATQGSPCAPGYNVADHLLDLAHTPPPALAQAQQQQQQQDSPSFDKEFRAVVINATPNDGGGALKKLASPTSAAAFLTQLEVLADREWKVLRRFV